MWTFMLRAFSFAGAVVLCGCVGLQQSREIPMASAQTADEVGKLPVGRVMAVEKKYFVDPPRNSMLGVIPNLVVGTDWYFRHQIKLLDGTVTERDEYAEIKVGDCVALRSHLVVPAYKGQCG